MRRIVVFIYALLVSGVLWAQDFREEFYKHSTGQEKQFLRTKFIQDSLFTTHVIQSWKTVHLNKPLVKPAEVFKPNDQPALEDSFELKEVLYKELEHRPPKLMRSLTQPDLDFQQQFSGNTKTLSTEFLGLKLNIEYPEEFFLIIPGESYQADDLGGFWLRCAASPFGHLVKQLHAIGQGVSMPDFGYVLMLEHILSEVGLAQNEIRLYQWFLLSKLGYAVSVGTVDSRPVLVISSLSEIYNHPFYQQSGHYFYVLDQMAGAFETYKQSDQNETVPFSFAIAEAIQWPLQPKSRKLDFTDKTGKSNDLQIYYNQHVADLLAMFPQTELANYLQSEVSDLMAKSLQVSVEQQLEDKSELEKIDWLLRFVQQSFPYRSDQLQFGKEKVLYPEEFLNFEFSDCEDRVILLSYMIRKFTDIPAIVIVFPQHVAMAVRFSAPVYGENVEYKGQIFTLVDPTYLNAPIGSVIPQADRTKMSVLEY